MTSLTVERARIDRSWSELVLVTGSTAADPVVSKAAEQAVLRRAIREGWDRERISEVLCQLGLKSDSTPSP